MRNREAWCAAVHGGVKSKNGSATEQLYVHIQLIHFAI